MTLERFPARSHMPRIIAGTFRSRRLVSPPAEDTATRPYTDRVKESLFNLLRGWFDDARVLDLFAGVGTMGLEAVSRGAAEVVMIEQHRKIFAMLEQNIAALDCADRARAVHSDALGPSSLLSAPKPVDVVFIDPPYAMMHHEPSRTHVLDQAARLRDVMADPSMLVLRTPLDPDRTDHDIDGFIGPESHRYGSDMFVLLYQPAVSEPQ